MSLVGTAKGILRPAKRQLSELLTRARRLEQSIRWRAVYLRTYYLALAHRSRLKGVTFVAITGSAGKTTTKDLTTMVLSAFGPCHSNVRSENEQIFIARTIQRVTRHDRFCVVEVSASRPNYVDMPVRLLRPDIAVLTLIGREHFSAFRSLEAIADEKGKLVRALSPTGVAVLNIDDPLVRAVGESCGRRVIWIGESEGATLKLRSATSSWPEPLVLDVEYAGKSFAVRTKLHGRHFSLAVLAALGVALAAGLPLEKAIEALAQAVPAEGRMQIVTADDGVVFVRDDWKAPEWSLDAPFGFMRDAKAQRKVAIIGSISDSSRSPTKRYPRVARRVLEFAELAVFIGPESLKVLALRATQDDRSLMAFPNAQEAARFLRTELRAGDLVLIKAINKSDHLVRLILDRGKTIQCWREVCGRSQFCDRCPLLYEPYDAGPAARPIPRMTTADHAMARTAGPPIVVVVGLGNPGSHYYYTAHNIGHRAVDALSRDLGGTWQAEPDGMVCTTIIAGVTAKLFKPGVGINASGLPIQRFLARAGAGPGDCIVIHDDMDLVLGDVRLKESGGDAGHKGLRSIISTLGTNTFRRLRIGVRRAGDIRQARQLVLEKFSAVEEATVLRGLEHSSRVLSEIIATVGATNAAGVDRAAESS